MRMIDADALIEDIDGDLTDSIAEGRAIEKIMNAPTIEERETGEWTKVIDRHGINGESVWRCSSCLEMTICKGDYCPNCGARMED